jgi:lipopolysaccharide biosynthesis glycosyltransferase
MTDKPKFIWTTLVMLGDEYACGAVTLCRSLRDVGTKYPIYCMVTMDVSNDCREFLKKHFDEVVNVPLIEYKCIPMKSKKQNEIYGSWIHASFTKCNILNPEVFPGVQKVCLLDADSIVIENIDDIFDVQTPAACFSSPWSREYMPRNSRYSLYDPYGKMKHGQLVPRKSIMRGFNNSFLGLACMVLVSPNNLSWETFNKILSSEPAYGNKFCVSGFDEQVLAETFLASGKNIYHISPVYCCLVGKEKIWLGGEKPKALQFYNGKPWREDPEKEGQYSDIIYWWQIAKTIIEENPGASQWYYQNQ